MGVIVDYYKNDRIYNNDIVDLVPTNLENYSVDNRLKKLVEEFDELTFGKRKELSDYANKIKCDKETLIYHLDLDKLIVGYYYNVYGQFNIQALISSGYAIGNVAFDVYHIFNKDSHVIKIKRDFEYGYIPEIDLTTMCEAYTNNYISIENVGVVCEELSLVNKSLESYYARKLTR